MENFIPNLLLNLILIMCEEIRDEYMRPLLQVTVVAAEIGFRGSGEGPSEGEGEQGSTTPGYDYEDDEWD